MTLPGRARSAVREAERRIPAKLPPPYRPGRDTPNQTGLEGPPSLGAAASHHHSRWREELALIEPQTLS